ncbi:hypothetical protein [Delftia sp. PS-11]|uniref:hypothetical protein n=1 Tax=Delftia sp. PS-11 TaxID=2767222 RepID=UPI002458273C|nr:hypothetical protein [Delftia sp. PS-11]KAJ8741826.1 hypothetical protein H9T68_20910 [Delftia sp. PS-11]
MPALTFFNNAESKLVAQLNAIGDDFSAVQLTLTAGTGALFGSPTEARRVRLTLSNPDVTSEREIIEARSRAGDVLSVYRGLEGTAVRMWPAGTTISNYLTAGAVNRFVLGGSDAYDHMQGGFAVGVAPFMAAANTHAPDSNSGGVIGPAGQLVGLPSGGSKALGVILKPGKTNGETSGDVYGTWGTARVAMVAREYSATGMSVGTMTVAGELGMAVGIKAAAGESSIAVGTDAFAVRQGVALGSNTSAVGERSFAAGPGALALGDSSTALGDGAYQAADHSVAFGALPTIPRVWRPADGNSENAWEYTGSEGIIASRTYDLGVPPTFSGGNVMDGDVFRPASGPLRYRALIPYDPKAMPNSFNAPAMNLPAFGMSNLSMDPANSNDATWVVHEGGAGMLVILSLPMHVLFFPSEVGFILFKSTSTSAPEISVGDANSDTALLAATALPGSLTAKAIHRLPITSGKGVENQLRFKLTAVANGQFLGRFYAKGLFINTQE